MSDHEEDYFLPLEDQRVFGAGIRRKRVQFVRSSNPDLETTSSALRTVSAPSTPSSNTTSAGASIANRYLSIVLSKSATPTPTLDSTGNSVSTTNTPTTELEQSHPATSSPRLPSPSAAPEPNPKDQSPICEICNLPLTTPQLSLSTNTNPTHPHEASLAHQLCLAHSHPPSHLDRTRHGLRYLSAYGWDPDSRVGLGAPGREGIREPVKGKLKVDTVGLGALRSGDSDEDDSESKRRKRKRGADRVPPSKIHKLNAKEVRQGHMDSQKRGERLRELFYRDERVLRYLGGGGEV
ncbi:putative G-patch domain protein [Aspergillus homomorphus CBS 101889]|uniref:G-patch domain-containing protein n=1 Tax=Aspergillus homomorphus (strain CBS 101889) TaxID=1450537 RepID=A0A395HZA7_ASPHC|nr:hypothetical protein BO97DRAFT_405230 [Aspergillus homomorphus CBS 101889]RAL13027.1 hypothetical protein BO97DRAFT_405230 [Aspergillus homomorphus CBS 101889]